MSKPISLVLILLVFAAKQHAHAQVKTTKLTKATIPKTVSYSGSIVQAVRYKDSTGDNIVILTTDETQSKSASDDSPDSHRDRDGELFAYHYSVSAQTAKQTWRVYDFVKECPVDMFLYFVKKSFAVTDLNKDGKAEVWIMYKVSCQGDVSAIPMKIIMYEDNKKFAARGSTRVKVSATEFEGGEFTFDDAFKSGPAEFRQYAEKLWKQNKTETWDH